MALCELQSDNPGCNLEKVAEKAAHLLQHPDPNPPLFVIVKEYPSGVLKIFLKHRMNLPAERFVFDNEIEFEVSVKTVLVEVR